jgi:hypothetical protein
MPDLVLRLIGTQFPEWVGLPVRPVDDDGWDNATLRHKVYREGN